MVATEDELSEAVCFRLINELGGRLEISPTTFRRGGFGYLKSRITSFLEIAARQPLLLLTDLDRADCPATLIEGWTSRQPIPTRMLFRVAVREFESWLLADHEGLRRLLGSRLGKLPADPDVLDDPKAALLRAALKAPRDVRMDLLPDKGSTATQGLGYNHRLVGFVRETWNPERAAERSDSLQRIRARLAQLADRLDATS